MGALGWAGPWLAVAEGLVPRAAWVKAWVEACLKVTPQLRGVLEFCSAVPRLQQLIC